jgi:hypothetical protein
MKQKTSRKLTLNKQKVSNLSNGEMRQIQGGTGFCSVIVATGACGSDFTRPMYQWAVLPILHVLFLLLAANKE